MNEPLNVGHTIAAVLSAICLVATFVSIFLLVNGLYAGVCFALALLFLSWSGPVVKAGDSGH